MNENAKKNGIKPYEVMKLILETTDIELISAHCKNLRIFFGSSFTQENIKDILKLWSNKEIKNKKDIITKCN